jgi:hypothetical protein
MRDAAAHSVYNIRQRDRDSGDVPSHRPGTSVSSVEVIQDLSDAHSPGVRERICWFTLYEWLRGEGPRNSDLLITVLGARRSLYWNERPDTVDCSLSGLRWDSRQHTMRANAFTFTLLLSKYELAKPGNILIKPVCPWIQLVASSLITSVPDDGERDGISEMLDTNSTFTRVIVQEGFQP